MDTVDVRKSESLTTADGPWVMGPAGLDRLVEALARGFDEVLGPVVADGAIRLRPITSAADLPIGVTDVQEAATYRLVDTGTGRRFSYTVGPDSLKAVVHPPRSPVWTMRRRDGSLVVEESPPDPTTRAVMGVRACDLRALGILARTQTGGPHVDPAFTARRSGLFLVAVDCDTLGPTCFCESAGGSRTAIDGFDLALTEVDDPSTGVAYVVRCGSERAQALVHELGLEPAPDDLVRRATVEPDRRPSIRVLPDDAASLVGQVEHPHWAEVAERCLTCGNCTAVCPTCFCTDMHDAVSLDGDTATRTRVWDTCFSQEYSHLGVGPHRDSSMARYRQWLTHKLGTWHEQFGESGCVGCGRCITWCPVGIDLTVEAEALRTPVGSAS